MADLPLTQYAVQLVGPDQLILNKSKEVFRPGRHQILCRVEAVGLCFSDLKLLKQFSSHVRKSEIVSGIERDVLREIPSYVPGKAATVPGHEVVVRIEEVGPDIEAFRAGQRYLVQTDYRWLHTASSNGAFGYNFEGALQEYVLMDERVITSPEGDSMLLPAGAELSASAIALVEPWACVEDAYASKERQSLKAGGQMLIVSDVVLSDNALTHFFVKYGEPAKMFQKTVPQVPRLPMGQKIPVVDVRDILEFEDATFDDVIYFGSDPNTVEALFPKVAAKGLLNMVLCGERFGRDIVTQIGRVHYGGIRIIGTMGFDPAESMAIIPETGEIRSGDRINVVGAGGPMGMMHVIRAICQGVEGVSVFAADVDDDRLATLRKIAAPLAEKHGVEFRAYNPTKEKITEAFDYTVLMAPVPELVGASVRSAAKHGIVNIFAGIPATVTGGIDLDTYIEKQLYFIGTSGSTLDDMSRMLGKAESGRLDTDVSVAAISGLEGAVEGIRAVENRSVAGKIIVYPACKGLPLVRLEELSEKLPEVARCLNGGLWNKKAEQALLQIHQNQ